jgi:hypothetical protein
MMLGGGVDDQPQIAHAVGDGRADVGRVLDDVVEHACGLERVRRREVEAEAGILDDLGGKVDQGEVLVERNASLQPQLITPQADRARDLRPAGAANGRNQRRHP